MAHREGQHYFDPTLNWLSGKGTANAFETLLRNHKAHTLADAAIDAFVQLISNVKGKNDLLFACFLDAEDRPSGALQIMPTIAFRLNLETSVWSRKADCIIKGHNPSRSEHAVIVYDVCLSGDTLSQVAKQLHARYGVRAAAAVVYVNESKKSSLTADKDLVLPVFDVVSGFETLRHVVASNSQETPVGKEGVIEVFTSSSRVGKEGIEPAKEGTMTPEKTTTQKGPSREITGPKALYPLAVLAFLPIAIYFVLMLLATIGVVPRSVVNNIREYITILSH